MPAGSDQVFVVLGNQLFAPSLLEDARNQPFFMAEDVGLCTYVRHHKLKITLFLAAMRSYADALRDGGFDLHYERLDGSNEALSYEDKLGAFLAEREGVTGLQMWQIEDRFFEARMQTFAKERGLALTFRPSPMFLTSREDFAAFARDRDSVQMAQFYSQQRKRLGIMMDGTKPRGGKWSFDQDNREKIPTDVDIVETASAPPTKHVKDVVGLIEKRFADHPGDIDMDKWWLPTTRAQSLAWLDAFLKDRFADFGPYEDALTVRQEGAKTLLWHSGLAPVMNMGLITPEEIVERALAVAEERDIPLQLCRRLRPADHRVARVHPRRLSGLRERQEGENFFGHEDGSRRAGGKGGRGSASRRHGHPPQRLRLGASYRAPHGRGYADDPV